MYKKFLKSFTYWKFKKMTRKNIYVLKKKMTRNIERRQDFSWNFPNMIWSIEWCSRQTSREIGIASVFVIILSIFINEMTENTLRMHVLCCTENSKSLGTLQLCVFFSNFTPRFKRNCHSQPCHFSSSPLFYLWPMNHNLF